MDNKEHCGRMRWTGGPEGGMTDVVKDDVKLRGVQKSLEGLDGGRGLAVKTFERSSSRKQKS